MNIQYYIYKMTSHPLFIAFIMGMMNIGGRFIFADIPKSVERLLTQYSIIRKIIWFAIFFIATRDWKTALLATLVVTVVFSYLMNESEHIARGIQQTIIPSSNLEK